MLQSCIHFVAGFEGLSPFDLAHLTEILLVKLEEVIVDRGGKEKVQFSQQDIKHAMINTMRVMKVEAAQNQIMEAQSQLSAVERYTNLSRKETTISMP